jgi:hypothetical protein
MLMRGTTFYNVTGCLLAAFLCLVLIPPAPPAIAADRAGDEFLAGYITSILERDLHWERDSYHLKVVRGNATIILFKDDPVQWEAADNHLRTIDGLHTITIIVKPTDAARPGAVSRFLRISGEGEAFPLGNLFKPLLADPKQPQFFVNIDRYKSPGVRYTMASVGFGETFGMYRFFGSHEGDGLQLNIEGGLFAQFNLEAPSSDLINADYTISVPATYRLGENSFRFRFYHQSSHLGDEYLLRENPERINLSYEAIELIYSREWRSWRGYGGGEYLVQREPADLKPMSVHWGIEYYGSKPLVWNGRPVGGVDMKSFEEHNWYIDTSVKAGLEFGHPDPGQRRVRLMAQWYKGYDPRGQFYNIKIESYGLGVSLGF